MKTTCLLTQRGTCFLGAGLLTFALAANVSLAQLYAYEGFNSPNLSAVAVQAPDNTTLTAVATSGTGWTGTWIVSNGNATDSVYKTTGLAFPASYTGSFTAVGGSAVNAGNTANSMLRLNLDSTVAANVNSGGTIYVSFLGRRQGAITPETGLDGTAAAGTYLNPYPRNAGVRFPNSATANNNGSLGLIGGNGNAAANNGWGAWGWKDTHGVMSGAGFTVDADFIVVELNPANSMVSYWVNPQTDGSADGHTSFIYTDGGNLQNIALYAFGVEAGSGNAQRAAGEWAFDEIRIAGSFSDAAGFTMVPEPSTYALFLGFFAVAGVMLRKRLQKKTA